MAGGKVAVAENRDAQRGKVLMAYNPHPSQKTLRMGHPKTRFAELSLRQGKQDGTSA